MKKILLTITAFLVTLFAVAQSPNLLNYQGVARNSVGNVLPSQPIGLRLSILSGGPTGTPVYTETRNVTTNAFGLFNVQVGSPGAITSTGTIAGINWTAFGVGSGTKYLQVEIDPIGGTNYFNVGSTQLVSVPYALYASGAAPVGPAGGDLTGTYPNPQILFPLIKTFSFNASPLIGMTNSSASGTTGAIQGTSASTDPSASAITGTISSTTPGGFSAGLRGINNGNAGLGIGVYGSQLGSGWGVYGTAPNGFGVNGLSTTSIGVNGSSTSGVGVAGTSTSAAGISGTSTSAAGVFGTSNTSNAGSFQNTNAANTASTVVGNSNGSGASVEGTNTGTGRGGFFQVLNAASTADAIRAETNGTGASWGIHAISSGTNGAGLFRQTNAANTANNLQSNQAGLGRAGLFNSTNAASTANAVDINVAGTGFALRAASTNAAAKALQTAGGLQLTGIGEANNFLLKSDAAGNATWSSPAGIGVVTGTGTLNFVPKWTPNGTNLGNSKIFDDGTFVGIGTTTPGAGLVVSGNGIWNSAIGIQNTGTGMEWRMNVNGNSFGITKIPGSTFTPFQLFSTGGMDFSNSAGTSIARLLDNGNVGVETTAPQHRLSVGPTTADVQGVMVRGFGGGPVNWKGGAAFGNTNATVIMGELGGVASIGGHNSNLSAWAPLAINGAPGNNVGIGTQTPAYALDVNHNGANGLHVRSLASFSVVDLDAANGDAALRYQSAGSTRWNVRNAPGTNDYQIVRNNSLPANVTINNGTGFVGITQTAPAYQMDVLHTGANGIRSQSSAGFSVVDIDANNGDAALRFQKAGVNDWHVGNGIIPGAGGFDIADFKAGAIRMVVMNGTGNVGIGTTAPNARLDVLNAANASAGNFVNTNAAATTATVRVISASASFAAPALNAISVSGSTYGGAVAGVYGNSFNNQATLGASDNNIGVHGASNFSNGVQGETFAGNNTSGVAGFGFGINYGVTGQAPNGTGGFFSGGVRALNTQGALQLQGIGEAAGRVLTTDAVGNATWQNTVAGSLGISIRGLTSGVNVPSAPTATTITNWAFIDNEDGGANFNTGTGEYTITRTGVYQINCSIGWGTSFNATDNRLQFLINGGIDYETLDFATTGSNYNNQKFSYARRLNAGQKISIAVRQNSGATQTTIGFVIENSLSIQFIHN